MIMHTKYHCAWLMMEMFCQKIAFGAYPISARSRSGMGPRDYKVVEELQVDKNFPKLHSYILDRLKSNLFECSFSKDKEKLDIDNMDFETVRNSELFYIQRHHFVHDSMKKWNMTIQYWMSYHVYRQISGPRIFKIFITLFVSLAWHGFNAGTIVLTIFLAVYVTIELVFYKDILEQLDPQSFASLIYYTIILLFFLN